MSRREQIDAVVVGGGVVGTACALGLSCRGLEVALVEAAEPVRWSADRRDLRVYAFAADNAALLGGLDVWSAVRDARAHAYRRMRVWDAGGGSELAFDADQLGRSELGWIVEHGLLVDRLLQALPDAGVRLHCPAKVVGLRQDDTGASVELDDGTRIDAKLVVAADGADSAVRDLLDLDVEARGYAQRGVVCFVASEQPHQDTAWQRFLPGGPIALLPFADRDSSIVWSLPDAEADRVLALHDAAFAEAVTRASDRRLGRLSPSSQRVAFPLRRQLAKRYRSGRVLLVGDAAHVVHPLAGQGVNLGLRDVAALFESVDGALSKRVDIAAPQRLDRWARQRRSENALAAHAFEGIHRLFTSERPAAALLRGPMLGLAGAAPPLVRAFWRHAAGV